MAKFGSGGGAGGAGFVPPPRRDGSTRTNTGTMQNGLMSGLNNLLPEKGSKARHEMVMQLVNAGMQSAQGSTSGLTNLLAPIVGAVAAGKSTSNFEEAEAGRNSETAASLLGDLAGDPQAQSYLAALNNPNTPAHLRSIAQSKLDAMMNPTGGGSGRASTPRVPSNTDMLLAQVLHSAMGEDSDGGTAISPAEAQRLQLIKDARNRSNAAAASGGSVVDELTGLLNGGGGGGGSPAQLPTPSIPTDDPLGLF